MMKMKYLALCATIACITQNVLAVETVTATSTCRGGCYPTFVDNYIKVASQGWLCGGLTITPKLGNVQIQAQLFYQPFLSKTWKPGPVTSGGWINLPAGGLRQRYDWGGLGASYHYRIYCRTITVGAAQQVNCSDVVEISSVKHNVGCVIGPAGPEAEYPPLNMNKG